MQHCRTLSRREYDLDRPEATLSRPAQLYVLYGVYGRTMATMIKIEIYGRKSEFADVVCAIGVMALICAQAPDLESDEDWEIDSTTAEMAQSVISVCLLYI